MADMEAAAFMAIADPTRRALLDRLRDGGPMTLTALADGLPMTRQAATKHLDALERAGLITVRHAGRTRVHELDPEPLRDIDRWLAPYAREWDERLGRLRRHVEEEMR
jgi:DNA-binding transcriptional ArsR family regulator